MASVKGTARLSGIPVEPLEPGSPEWLANISASQIAAIAGVSPWETAHSLFWKKRGDLPAGEGNHATRTGHFWEPVLRGWYADANPRRDVSGPRSYQHPEHPWATASPDGIVDESLCLEIKTARSFWAWGPEGSDDIPPNYTVQVQWQMWVTGAEATVMVAAGPHEVFDRTFREYEIWRDDALISDLVAAAEQFRLACELDVPPDPDWAVRADRETLRKLAVPRTDDSIELDDGTAIAWITSRNQAATSENELAAAKAALLAAAGSARRLVWRGAEIASFRNSKHGPALHAAPDLDDILARIWRAQPGRENQ